MRINSELLKEIEKYSSDFIIRESSVKLTYHTIEHTRQIVKNAEIIGANENLNEDEMNILLTSAWFHDIGYIKNYQGHEKESVAIAANFLKLKDVDKDISDLVSECILATTLPQQPTNKIANVLCDADMMHLGVENYYEIAEKYENVFIDYHDYIVPEEFYGDGDHLNKSGSRLFSLYFLNQKKWEDEGNDENFHK